MQEEAIRSFVLIIDLTLDQATKRTPANLTPSFLHRAVPASLCR